MGSKPTVEPTRVTRYATLGTYHSSVNLFDANFGVTAYAPLGVCCALMTKKNSSFKVYSVLGRIEPASQLSRQSCLNIYSHLGDVRSSQQHCQMAQCVPVGSTREERGCSTHITHDSFRWWQCSVSLHCFNMLIALMSTFIGRWVLQEFFSDTFYTGA